MVRIITTVPLFAKPSPERRPGHSDEQLIGLGAFVRISGVDPALA